MGGLNPGLGTIVIGASAPLGQVMPYQNLALPLGNPEISRKLKR